MGRAGLPDPLLVTALFVIPGLPPGVRWGLAMDDLRFGMWCRGGVAGLPGYRDTDNW